MNIQRLIPWSSLSSALFALLAFWCSGEQKEFGGSDPAGNALGAAFLALAGVVLLAMAPVILGLKYLPRSAYSTTAQILAMLSSALLCLFIVFTLSAVVWQQYKPRPKIVPFDFSNDKRDDHGS